MALRLVSREVKPLFLQVKTLFPQAAFTSRNNSDSGNSENNRGTWYKKGKKNEQNF